jgi:hypothetical protein
MANGFLTKGSLTTGYTWVKGRFKKKTWKFPGLYFITNHLFIFPYPRRRAWSHPRRMKILNHHHCPRLKGMA